MFCKEKGNQPEFSQQTFVEKEIRQETCGDRSSKVDAPSNIQRKKPTASQAENEENEAKFLRSSFGSESVVHSFHKCKSKSCSSVSSSEQDCLAKRSDDRLHHHWINENMTFCSKTGYNWLLYEEGQGMFCLLCRKHNVVNTKNKSKKFNMEPAVRFKKKAVEEHANSQQHSAAITAYILFNTQCHCSLSALNH